MMRFLISQVKPRFVPIAVKRARRACINGHGEYAFIHGLTPSSGLAAERG